MWKQILGKAIAFIKHPQVYSFAKTYVTVFLTLYLKGVTEGASEGGDIMIADMAVISVALKWSFIAVLRNIYKLATER